MPLWLYDLPNWAFGLAIVLGWIAIGVGGHVVLHRFMKVPFHDHDKEVAIALLAVVATVNSLLLAFSAISVWEAFGSADRAVSAEANVVGELARDLSVFGAPEAVHARDDLQRYARAVVDDEWPAMRLQQDSPTTWDAFDDTFRAVGQLRPATPAQMVLLPEIWARANELIKFRRNRIDAGHGEVPGTLWIVVILGTLMTIVPTYVLPRKRFNTGAIALLSAAMGLVFFFVAAMDRPFVGKESIDAAPFERSLERMAKWDERKEVRSTVRHAP